MQKIAARAQLDAQIADFEQRLGWHSSYSRLLPSLAPLQAQIDPLGIARNVTCCAGTARYQVDVSVEVAVRRRRGIDEARIESLPRRAWPQCGREVAPARPRSSAAPARPGRKRRQHAGAAQPSDDTLPVGRDAVWRPQSR